MHIQKINWKHVAFTVGCFAVAACILCVSQTGKRDESAVAFKQNQTESAERHAEELLRALYGRRVTFRRETGDGTNFTTRYYCSNVCIDACADGNVRYLCDIRSARGEDPLLAWLFGQDTVSVLCSEQQYGMENRLVQSERCFAELCINLSTKRVFAAKITFTS